MGTAASIQRNMEFRRGWPVLLAATLGSAAGLSSLPFYTLGTFISPLQEAFGWSRGEIASSYLFTTAVLVVTAPLLGILADRVGVRLVALVSVPLFSAALFLLSQASGSINEFHLIFGLAALIGGGATPVSYTRAVNDAFRRSRGLALGISLAGIGAAAIGLPILVTMINISHGWRAGYQALAIIALLPWPFLLLGLPTRMAQRERRPLHASYHVLRLRLFWTLVAIFVAVAMAVSALIVHMPPLLLDAGADPLTAASITGLLGLGLLLGRLVTGWLVDRFFAPHVAGVAFAISAAGCLLLAVFGTGMAQVAAITTGLALGAEVDLMAYFVARYFGMADYAFLYGILYSLFTLGGAVGPALAGVSFDRTGSYTLTLWGSILLLVAAAAAVTRLRRFSDEAGSDG